MAVGRWSGLEGFAELEEGGAFEAAELAAADAEFAGEAVDGDLARRRGLAGELATEEVGSAGAEGGEVGVWLRVGHG
jgi:hypothetical protein